MEIQESISGGENRKTRKPITKERLELIKNMRDEGDSV